MKRVLSDYQYREVREERTEKEDLVHGFGYVSHSKWKAWVRGYRQDTMSGPAQKSKMGDHFPGIVFILNPEKFFGTFLSPDDDGLHCLVVSRLKHRRPNRSIAHQISDRRHFSMSVHRQQ